MLSVFTLLRIADISLTCVLSKLYLFAYLQKNSYFAYFQNFTHFAYFQNLTYFACFVNQIFKSHAYLKLALCFQDNVYSESSAYLSLSIIWSSW